MSLSRPASLSNPLRLLLLLAALLLPGLASADTQDVTAASRSVVRVALVATDGESAYFVGHGSGVVVAPGKVLTNAHVVELTRPISPSASSRPRARKAMAGG
jgi:S1-C subfamily serine protease